MWSTSSRPAILGQLRHKLLRRLLLGVIHLTVSTEVNGWVVSILHAWIQMRLCLRVHALMLGYTVQRLR